MPGLRRQMTRTLSALLCGLGLVLVILALARGGGPGSNGVVLGVLFVLLGAGRFFLARETRA